MADELLYINGLHIVQASCIDDAYTMTMSTLSE